VVPSYVSNLGLLPWLNFLNLLHFFIGLVILHNSTIQFVLFDNCFKSKIFLINYKNGCDDTWSSTWYTDNILFKTSYETNNTSRSNDACYFNNCTQFIESYVKYYEPKWLKYNFVTNISRVVF
jgi:hypothetical protein